jgi:ligand-binding sensor domain-containing protein
VIDESKGILYAGTFGGISSYDGTDWETYTTSEGLISDNVFDLHVDASGNLYAATA